MNTLYLLRHAKSSWDDTYMPDRDRPLAARGERDAARISMRWSPPTCALAEYRFDAKSWSGIGLARPARTIFDSPKQAPA